MFIICSLYVSVNRGWGYSDGWRSDQFLTRVIRFMFV
jgi:hypothetical protein